MKRALDSRHLARARPGKCLVFAFTNTWAGTRRGQVLPHLSLRGLLGMTDFSLEDGWPVILGHFLALPDGPRAVRHCSSQACWRV